MKQDIEFIREILGKRVDIPYTDVGDKRYYKITLSKVAKVGIARSSFGYGIVCEIINTTNGVVDRVELPFSNYFSPKQCSPGSPTWHQSIDNGEWRYERTDKHCLPTPGDFKKISLGLHEYISLFCN